MRGELDLRPEAAGAALIAEAAARTAAHPAAVNLAVGAEDDRVREAEGHAETAAESAQQALST